jgi:starvation-inducible outer membrane lipoprotein
MKRIKNLIPLIALLGMAACNAEPKEVETETPAVIEEVVPVEAPQEESDSKLNLKIGTNDDGEITGDIEAEIKK